MIGGVNGVNPQQMMEQMFRKVDSDGDGQLSKAEFDSHAQQTGFGGDKLQELFARVDTDGDGLVSKEDLKNAFM